MSDEKEHLEEWEKEAVLFVERVHSKTGAVPSDDDIIDYLRFLKFPVNSETILMLKENKLFQASMLIRGIPISTDPEEELKEDKNKLTARQMAAAAVMLNLTDRRSDEKKLRDLGISTEEYATWMQNNTFAQYMRERSEQLVNNSLHEAHMGLLRGIRQGNTKSIQLYYAMTGRYNPDEEHQVNIRLLIGQVLEAIQKHVKNPETLNKLALELSQLSIEAGSPVAKHSFIPGEATRKELM